MNNLSEFYSTYIHKYTTLQNHTTYLSIFISNISYSKYLGDGQTNNIKLIAYLFEGHPILGMKVNL